MDIRGPIQSGAKQINAWANPNSIDVTQISDAFQKAAVATTNWTQNVIGGAGLDILAAAPAGAAAPLARDIGNVYESTFVHRKEIANEVNNFVKTFEKREQKFQSQLGTAHENLKQANGVFETCMARSENIEKVHESIKKASKSIQTLLECELRCENARAKSRQEREEAQNGAKQAFLAEINRKREEIEQQHKDKEAELIEKYKREGTEGFV